MASNSVADSGLWWLLRHGRREASRLQQVVFLASLALFSAMLVVAVVQVLRINQRLPGSSMDSLALARRHASAGDWAAAAAEYRAAYFVNWLGRQDISALATALGRAGDRPQLIEVLQRAARLSADPDVHMRLTALLLQGGDTAAAVATMDHFVELYPSLAGAHLSRGKLHSELKQNAAALASFERAVQLDPNLEEAWFAVARTQLAERRLDEALAAFRRVLALNPKMAVAHNGIGLIYRERGDEAGARQAFRTALEIDPSLRAAQQNLDRLNVPRAATGDSHR